MGSLELKMEMLLFIAQVILEEKIDKILITTIFLYFCRDSSVSKRKNLNDVHTYLWRENSAYDVCNDNYPKFGNYFKASEVLIVFLVNVLTIQQLIFRDATIKK